MLHVPRMLDENRELITAATRKRAFGCACALLREEGWRGFTMEKLATRMGVAKGTLYNYFKDKESVILFIRDRVSEHAAAALEREMERTADTRALLEAWMIGMLRGMKEYHFLHAPLGEIVLRRMGDGSLNGLPHDGGAHRNALARLIERGMSEGVFRKGDPALTAALIQSAVAGVDMGCCFDGLLDTESEQVQETLCGVILRGICTDKAEERA